MKAFKSALLIVIILGSVGYSVRLLLIGPCDAPKKYRIGAFDERFKITEAQFLLAAQEAERIWEEAVGKDLFVLDSAKGFPVSLVYDERQATSQRNQALESGIEQTEASAQAIKRGFEALKKEHAEKQAQYDSALARFRSEQDAYNGQISYWNSRGGAPKAEYEKLENERVRLEGAYAALESMRFEVNRLAGEINTQIGRYNYLVREVNESVDIINESADKEFEQGEFVRDRGDETIEIYAFRDREDLVRVLAHEFGHALDVDHNSNPDSVMYYLNSSNNMTPTTEDVMGVKTACGFKN